MVFLSGLPDGIVGILILGYLFVVTMLFLVIRGCFWLIRRFVMPPDNRSGEKKPALFFWWVFVYLLCLIAVALIIRFQGYAS